MFSVLSYISSLITSLARFWLRLLCQYSWYFLEFVATVNVTWIFHPFNLLIGYYYKHICRDTVVHVSWGTCGGLPVSFGISPAGFWVYTLSVLPWMPKNAKLFPNEIVPISAPTNSAWELPLFYVITIMFLIGLFNVGQYGGYKMGIFWF